MTRAERASVADSVFEIAEQTINDILSNNGKFGIDPYDERTLAEVKASIHRRRQSYSIGIDKRNWRG